MQQLLKLWTLWRFLVRVKLKLSVSERDGQTYLDIYLPAHVGLDYLSLRLEYNSDVNETAAPPNEQTHPQSQLRPRVSADAGAPQCVGSCRRA